MQFPYLYEDETYNSVNSVAYPCISFLQKWCGEG